MRRSYGSYTTQELKKKAIKYSLIALVLYLFIRKSTYEFESKIHVKNVTPSIIFEYVSEFKHMKILNPTITDFRILSDNYVNAVWTYSVEYSEILSHWPYSRNVAVAHIQAKKVADNHYTIESRHTTCLFGNVYCLVSKGLFIFTINYNEGGTDVKEIVNYECPVILSAFCKREVSYQRDAIAKNLQKEYVMPSV